MIVLTGLYTDASMGMAFLVKSSGFTVLTDFFFAVCDGFCHCGRAPLVRGLLFLNTFIYSLKIHLSAMPEESKNALPGHYHFQLKNIGSRKNFLIKRYYKEVLLH